MKQILVIMAVVVASLSVVADEVLINDPVLKEYLGKRLKKPYGKFAPPMKLTETDLAKVVFLNLVRTKITDAGLKEVAKLQHLNYLRLSDTKITDVGLKELAKLQKLERLYLLNTKITDAGLKDIAKLQQLEFLSLPKTQITDTGLKDVAKLQKLETLVLQDTKVTKAGVAELKMALPNCTIDAP